MYPKTASTSGTIGILLALVAGAACISAQAQEWEITPSIFTSVMRTDNIGLTPDDIKIEDTSFELSPQLMVNHDGPRFDLYSRYRMQIRRFQETSENNQIFNTLNLTSDIHSSDDLFGVVGLANISQQIIDRSEGIGITNAARVANQANVGSYAIEPYLNFDAGASTAGRVSYRLGLVEFDQPDLVDSRDNRFFAIVTSDPANVPWSVGASFSHSNIDFDTGREITLTRISADFGYRITPRTDFVLTLGLDDNDLGSAPTTGPTDGFFWLAGVRGSLSQATDFEARVGEQFFGDSYLFSFNHRRGRVALTVSYNEQAQTFGGAQLNGITPVGSIGAPGAPPGYDQLLREFADVGGLDLPNVSQDLFISKRLNIGATYTRANNSWQVNFFNDDREYITTLDGGLEDSGRGVTARWTWDASSRLTLALSANWQRFELRDSDDQPDDLRYELNLRRSFLRGAYASLRLLHNQRRSSNANRDFDENAIIIGAGYEF